MDSRRFGASAPPVHNSLVSRWFANLIPQPNLPPDLAQLAHIVDAEPPDVQELFQYALTMLLIEDGKAQIVERRKIDCREWLTVLTVADELPGGDIVKPDVSDARLAQLRDGGRG